MNTKPSTFSIILDRFSRFLSILIRLYLSLTMLFPCGPGRCVVGSVVRNAPQPLPVSFADRDGGAFFMPLGCLDCNFEDRIRQVLSVQSTAQELGDCIQKEAYGWIFRLWSILMNSGLLWSTMLLWPISRVSIRSISSLVREKSQISKFCPMRSR